MDSDSNALTLQRSTSQESARSRRVTLAWAYTRMGRPDTTEDPKLHYYLEYEKENQKLIYYILVFTN